MTRDPIWREIVAAHRAGDIDLTETPLTVVALQFECSTHTVSCARKHLGIKLQARPFYRKFQNDEKWNESRRDLLERWPR